MNNNNHNPKKGNESERKTLDDISPKDVFGDPSPTDEDGIPSSSGKFILWTDDTGDIFVEKQNGERISRQIISYLQRLDKRGYAMNVSKEGHSRVKISVDFWLIASKDETDQGKNKTGDADDLLPIIAKAL